MALQVVVGYSNKCQEMEATAIVNALASNKIDRSRRLQLKTQSINDWDKDQRHKIMITIYPNRAGAYSLILPIRYLSVIFLPPATVRRCYSIYHLPSCMKNKSDIALFA